MGVVQYVDQKKIIGFGQSSAHPLQDDEWQKLSGVVAYLTRVNTAHHVTHLYAVEIMHVMTATQ